MEIFDFSEYKKFVSAWVKSQPRNGHGQFRRISEFVGLNTVSVSQIFTGTRDLSPEQALRLARYLALTPLETEYFVILVQLERAGSEDLRLHLRVIADRLRNQSRELRTRIPKRAVLSDEAKAVFYSKWLYSAVRLATSINGLHTLDELAAHFEIPRPEIVKCVEFLLRHGLCEMKGDEIHMGASWTHLDHDSPFIYSRQVSWRLKGFQQMDTPKPNDLYFTSPVVLSQTDFERIRAEIVKFVSNFRLVVEPSPSEQLACLNIDWFRI